MADLVDSTNIPTFISVQFYFILSEKYFLYQEFKIQSISKERKEIEDRLNKFSVCMKEILVSRSHEIDHLYRLLDASTVKNSNSYDSRNPSH